MEGLWDTHGGSGCRPRSNTEHNYRISPQATGQNKSENCGPTTRSVVTSPGGENLRETIISPGRILLGLSADTLFGGV